MAALLLRSASTAARHARGAGRPARARARAGAAARRATRHRARVGVDRRSLRGCIHPGRSCIRLVAVRARLRGRGRQQCGVAGRVPRAGTARRARGRERRDDRRRRARRRAGADRRARHRQHRRGARCGRRVPDRGRLRLPSGDEASGAWLGVRALAYAQQALDGRVPCDAFASALLAETGAQDRDALVQWSCDANQTVYARLAPIVFAHRAHPVAAALIAQAGDEIGKMIDALDPQHALPVALCGGLADALAPAVPARHAGGCAPARRFRARRAAARAAGVAGGGRALTACRGGRKAHCNRAAGGNRPGTVRRATGNRR